MTFILQSYIYIYFYIKVKNLNHGLSVNKTNYDDYIKSIYKYSGLNNIKDRSWGQLKDKACKNF